jgi:hypothetical protein
VFQVEDLLLAAVAAFMSRHADTFMPQLDGIGLQPGLNLRSRRQWNRVAIGSHTHATQSVHRGEAGLRQLKGLCGQRQQMRLLAQHRRAHRFRAPAQNAPLILPTALLQVTVQFAQIASFRQRHPVVATEVSAFAFDAALFVAPSRVAELALITPVRPKGDEAAGLLSLISAQDLLHRTRQVVITQEAEDAIEIAKRQFVCFQKRLLRGMRVSPVIRCSAGHRAHLENLQLDPLSA